MTALDKPDPGRIAVGPADDRMSGLRMKSGETGWYTRTGWSRLPTGRGWTLRCTLELNRKLVGKRVKIRLRTRCLREAVERRERIARQYRRLGFKVSGRRQRKRAG